MLSPISDIISVETSLPDVSSPTDLTHRKTPMSAGRENTRVIPDQSTDRKRRKSTGSIHQNNNAEGELATADLDLDYTFGVFVEDCNSGPEKSVSFDEQSLKRDDDHLNNHPIEVSTPQRERSCSLMNDLSSNNGKSPLHLSPNTLESRSFDGISMNSFNKVLMDSFFSSDSHIESFHVSGETSNSKIQPKYQFPLQLPLFQPVTGSDSLTSKPNSGRKSKTTNKGSVQQSSISSYCTVSWTALKQQQTLGRRVADKLLASRRYDFSKSRSNKSDIEVGSLLIDFLGIIINCYYF